ncbi:MAG: hypothetical protein ACPGRX_03450 [Bdellovibrionales bacterium]
MPTDKPRLNITLNDDIEGTIAFMATRNDVSKSTMARMLIEQAIEYNEDYHLSKLALERDTEDAVWVADCDEIWE